MCFSIKNTVSSFVLILLVSACSSSPEKNTKGLYIDSDPAAYAVHPAAFRRNEFIVELEQKIDEEPENSYFIAVRAYEYCFDGNIVKCDEYYARALSIKTSSPEDMRHVLWSKAWSMFTAQRYQEAIADWKEAERLHGGKPYWLAYTICLAYWRAGDKNEAVRYFNLAVKSNNDWGNDIKRAKLTAHWKSAEKMALLELVGYWKTQGR